MPTYLFDPRPRAFAPLLRELGDKADGEAYDFILAVYMDRKNTIPRVSFLTVAISRALLRLALFYSDAYDYGSAQSLEGSFDHLKELLLTCQFPYYQSEARSNYRIENDIRSASAGFNVLFPFAMSKC
jgi:hypothetical protein